jgi:hypothetical protein
MGVAISNEPAEDNNEDNEGDTDNNLGSYTGVNIHGEPLTSQLNNDLYHDGTIGQKDIAATIHPGWQAAPPVNFGAPAHGKLKVDQWRSCIEFDIPISLVQLWVADTGVSDDQWQKLVESSTFLAMALHWVTSH